MTKNHIHRYSRQNIGKDKEHWVMQCNLPDCNHYIAGKSKLSFPQLKGKVAKCNKCDDEFMLDKRALRMAKPICVNCVNKKEDPKVKSADQFFKDLMESVK